MERVKLKEDITTDKSVRFFSSGSTLLDLALGAGWALPRIFNIVGDKSTGKTLLAIEAFANFNLTFPKGRMRYAEAEAAFDDVFAETLGFPPTVERPDRLLQTVEEFRDDLCKFARAGGEPGLYILDSLDALTDDAELKKFEKDMKAKDKAASSDDEDDPKIKGSYGTAKAKKMSELFRLLVREMNENNCTLGVISQIRDKINVMFGEKYTRSGGHALDFYCAQVLWLAETGKKTKTSLGHTRAVGVDIHGKVKKNKVALPFREADFGITFGYGIDDESSMLEWLRESGMTKETHKEITQKLIVAREKHQFDVIKSLRDSLRADCQRIWKQIEDNLAPPIRKYGQAPQN